MVRSTCDGQQGGSSLHLPHLRHLLQEAARSRGRYIPCAPCSWKLRMCFLASGKHLQQPNAFQLHGNTTTHLRHIVLIKEKWGKICTVISVSPEGEGGGVSGKAVCMPFANLYHRLLNDCTVHYLYAVRFSCEYHQHSVWSDPARIADNKVEF